MREVSNLNFPLNLVSNYYRGEEWVLPSVAFPAIKVTPMQWNTPCNSVKVLQQRVKCQKKKVLFVEVRGMGRTKSIN